MNTEESKETLKKHPAEPISREEIEAKFTSEDQSKVTSLFNEEIGFTKVIQVLINAKKPLIAHNPQYDVTFLYEQFIAPLPNSFLEFCAQWKRNFPTIYDTKAVFYEISHDVGRNKSNLQDVFKKVQTDKKYSSNLMINFDVQAGEAFGTYNDYAQAHHAGYDAYMTGHVFAVLAKKLEIDQLVAPLATEKPEEKS